MSAAEGRLSAPSASIWACAAFSRAPRSIAILGNAAGTVARAYGLREIGTGIGILASKDPSPWLWGRVAGDALDVPCVLVTADSRTVLAGGIAYFAFFSIFPALAGASNFVLVNGTGRPLADVSIRRAGTSDWKPLEMPCHKGEPTTTMLMM